MSDSLNSLSVRVRKSLPPTGDFDGPSAFLNEASPTTETTFLTAAQHGAPESFLGLGEPSRTPENSPSTEVEVGGQVLLSGNDGVVGDDEVASDPLLFLDPSSGLHVLVHNLCQTIQQPNISQDENITPEQYVVVWALQSEEEEPMVLERTLKNKPSNLDASTSVDTLLRSPVVPLESNARDDPPVQQMFSSTIEPTLDLGIPLPPTQNYESNQLPCKETATSSLQHKDSSLISCSDSPILTLQVTDEGNVISNEELPRDLMESVPHINLEEIIEKFTSESNHQMIRYEDENIISEKNNEYSVNVERESLPLQDDLSAQSSLRSVLPDEKIKAAPKSDVPVTVKLKSADVIEESIDEESLYDIVMTYKCKLCSEVFIEKPCLLQHYEEIHRPRNGVKKICVTSKNKTGSFATLHSESGSNSKKVTISTLHSDTSLQRSNLKLITCKHCFHDFLDERALQEHTTQEHPSEPGKKAKKRAHKVILGLPTQPGILIGHREERLQSQVDSDEDKTINQKRRIRAPKNLNEEYWLHKNRLKPVFKNELKKHLKCAISSCRYKFSTKEKLQEHEECHGRNNEEKLFYCFQCSEKFVKWPMCQVHLWKIHGLDVDLFTCGICHTYKTHTEQRLLVHQKIHSDVRGYICKICGKGFRQQTQLLNHEVIHISNKEAAPLWHQKAFCTECKKWFGDKQTLKKHLNNVHLKVKRHSCPHCPYKCTRKFDLDVHIRKHTGEKPHKCELCGHWFRDYNTIRRHKFIHFLNKPFKCPHDSCQFECCYGPRFKKHVAKKHPEGDAYYKCQTCSMETPDVQKYISHLSVHEEYLFKEAMEKRTGDPLLRNSHSADQNMYLKMQSNLLDEVNIVNINIESIDDEGSHIREVHIERNETESTFPNIKPETFVFESVAGESDASLQNSQVFTINVDNLEPSNSLLEKTENTSHLEKLEPDLQKTPEPQQIRLSEILESSLLEPNHQDASVLSVIHNGNNLEPELLGSGEHKSTALTGIESHNRTPAVVSVEEDQTLMTLSQVMSEDDHQYIIGISPEEIAASQANIFAMEQDEQ